eukprot:1146203-Pelagomonas_calceolata.AAC.1
MTAPSASLLLFIDQPLSPAIICTGSSGPQSLKNCRGVRPGPRCCKDGIVECHSYFSHVFTYKRPYMSSMHPTQQCALQQKALDFRPKSKNVEAQCFLPFLPFNELSHCTLFFASVCFRSEAGELKQCKTREVLDSKAWGIQGPTTGGACSEIWHVLFDQRDRQRNAASAKRDYGRHTCALVWAV